MAKITGVGGFFFKTADPSAHGRFAHVPGPDGITLELGQPADPHPYDPGA